MHRLRCLRFPQSSLRSFSAAAGQSAGAVLGSGADRAGIDGARVPVGAAADPAGAADLEHVSDICPQRGMQFLAMCSVQVDLVLSAVQTKADGALDAAA